MTQEQVHLEQVHLARHRNKYTWSQLVNNEPGEQPWVSFVVLRESTPMVSPKTGQIKTSHIFSVHVYLVYPKYVVGFLYVLCMINMGAQVSHG